MKKALGCTFPSLLSMTFYPRSEIMWCWTSQQEAHLVPQVTLCTRLQLGFRHPHQSALFCQSG